MKSRRIDISMLQETNVNVSQKERRGDCEWRFSSGVDPAKVAEAAAMRAGGWKTGRSLAAASVEHFGVAIVVRVAMREDLEKHSWQERGCFGWTSSPPPPAWHS